VGRTQDAKKWERYRQAKEAKRVMSIALMRNEGDEADDATEEVTNLLPKQRTSKGSSHAEKTRRKARFAHAAERCYWPDKEDEAMLSMPPQAKQKSTAKGRAGDEAMEAMP
jgi:hypothetical protein